MIHAEILPSPLAGLAGTDGRGVVLATFDRSLYLDLDGRIVAAASADLSRGPITITLNRPGPLPAVTAAAPVQLTAGLLRIGDLAVDLREATLWDPTLPTGVAFVRAGDASTASRAIVVDELLAAAPDESIVGLLGPRRGSPRRTDPGPLLSALSRGLDAIGAWLSGRLDASAATAIVAREVAGRGPGLTPSGDDLLLGIMLGAGVLPGVCGLREARQVRELLASATMPHTTRISSAYLDAARHGWAGEPWHALIGALAGPADSLRSAVRQLLRIGETSGADALTGFCWVWRAR